MEPCRFDQLTSALAEPLTRRALAADLSGGLAAALGLAMQEPAAASHKQQRRRKRKQRKKSRCTSAYGAKPWCKPDQCCDPATPTIASCTEVGFPTCCASSGHAHPLGATCCTSYFHGGEGACPTDYPVCCSGDLGGGCCLPGAVCCDPAVTGGRFCCAEAYPYCCPQQCGATNAGCDANGFCRPARPSVSTGPAPVAWPASSTLPANSADFTKGVS